MRGNVTGIKKDDGEVQLFDVTWGCAFTEYFGQVIYVFES